LYGRLYWAESTRLCACGGTHCPETMALLVEGLLLPLTVRSGSCRFVAEFLRGLLGGGVVRSDVDAENMEDRRLPDLLVLVTGMLGGMALSK
jgi:hypothetical protein